MYESNIWNKKSNRAERAQRHKQDMDRRFKQETEQSIRQTKVYSPNSQIKTDSTSSGPAFVNLVDTDTVTALFLLNPEPKDKICVMNFASFKKPGGMFLNGSGAQEECLCHESNLYNILSAFADSYYEENRKNVNKSLYRNRALYSPNVVFEKEGIVKKCDVLTCAAPNFESARKYHNISNKENHMVLQDRIQFICEILLENKVDTFIFGAWGAGVFGQDAAEVATLFLEEYRKMNHKPNVIFAVPDDPRNGNYQKIKKVFDVNHLIP